jgi:CRISPR system Cascade subunit CasD
MPTLLLRLAGPMQSWGTASRFTERDTGPEPSKSGLLGLLCAALGLDRADWGGLAPLTRLRLGVRHDRRGVLRHDYQTAGGNAEDAICKADGTSEKHDGIVSKRGYLADAVFLAGLEGSDLSLLASLQEALKNPVWPLCLGRKSYVPSEPVWLTDGLRDEALRPALSAYPWLGGRGRSGDFGDEKLALSLEAETAEGILRLDQPLASFAERRFGGRYVISEMIINPGASGATAAPCGV